MATAQVEERQLLKAMTWWDGFVVALANPAFLIAALGGSIGALGTTGAFLLWTISICLGALQNNIHAELACMFPNKSGGVALYAHEAWRKYLTLIGPLATFGYWIGWSVVLSVNGLVAGVAAAVRVLLVARLVARAAPGFTLTLPVVFGCVLIADRLALQRVRRPAGRVVRLRHRARLLCIPAFVLMFLPYVTGDWHSSNMTWLDRLGRRAARSSSRGCTSCAGRRTASRWSRRSRPSSTTPRRTPPKALRSSALFCVAVYALLPLGLGGTLGTDGDRQGHDAHRLLRRRVRPDPRQRARQGDDPLHRRRPRAVDEHGDDGRLARACTASPRTG